MKTAKDIIGLIAIFLLLLLMFGLYNRKPSVKIEHSIDTVIVRDTVRDTVLQPVKVYIARVDTVWMQAAADTVRVAVQVPIERREYETDEYRAVIEGYRPELVEMSVFTQTHYITDRQVTTIKKKPRFGVGVQLGYGLTPDKAAPYIGVGVQYNLWTW